MLLPKTRDGRVLFVIPWHDHILIGTTDTPVADPVIEPRALDTEIDFILETANQYLSSSVTRQNVLSVFAGIRPLVRSRGIRRTSALSRGHRLDIDEAGLVTITGGKWTTYRRMAEDAVNAAVDQGGLVSAISVTADLQIDQPSSPTTSGPLLHPEHPYTEFDVIRSVENEFARTVEDVLARRTRMLFLNASHAIETAPRVAEIMASLLGKNAEWVRSQLEEFEALAANYRIR
jgi:glycerol-3-phosphate dehydrogenase